jgi:hypothetical protein
MCQACATWLVHHPYLLADKECLATVVEVAELGVSGSKSQQKASDPPVMKVNNIFYYRYRKALANPLGFVDPKPGPDSISDLSHDLGSYG